MILSVLLSIRSLTTSAPIFQLDKVTERGSFHSPSGLAALVKNALHLIAFLTVKFIPKFITFIVKIFSKLIAK